MKTSHSLLDDVLFSSFHYSNWWNHLPVNHLKGFHWQLFHTWQNEFCICDVNRIVIVGNKTNSWVIKNDQRFWSLQIIIIVTIKKWLAFYCLGKHFLNLFALFWTFFWNRLIWITNFCGLSLIFYELNSDKRFLFSFWIL